MSSSTIAILRGLRHASQQRRLRALLVLACLLFMSVLASLTLGASHIPLPHVLDVIGTKLGWTHGLASAGEHAIITTIRLPRAVFAAVAGAALAMAGVLVQAVFRNPLAAPDVIGTSGGAACGATMALTIIPSSAPLWMGVIGVPISAFIGGMIATFLVLYASDIGGRTSSIMMLLVGIAINAFAGAFVGLLTALSTDTNLRSITSWMLGSIAGSDWLQVGVVTISTLIGGLFLRRKAQRLDALSLGEIEAWASGIDVVREKRSAVIWAALLSGTVVAFAGMIGFIALVIPHLVRLMLGAAHKSLIPASALAGATLFLLSDTLARTIIAPRELPVGVITAFIGAPIFLFLLFHGAKRQASWLS